MAKCAKKIIETKVISNKRIAADHYLMKLAAAHLKTHAVPGQFVAVKVRAAGTDPLLRIPLGVHAKTEKGIDLLYKVVGPATKILSSRSRGEALDVLGPLGNGFDLAEILRAEKPRAIIVAGGHGVAPLYFLGQTFAKRKIKMDVFIGACEVKHIVCAKEFRKMDAKVKTVAEKGRCACTGYVTEPLEKHLEKIKLEKIKNEKGKSKNKEERIEIFACGPRPMLAAVAREAEKHRISAQVSLDAYMACGIGACLGCAIETNEGYKLVCKDGPVFDARQIRWENIC